jgi:hypothetical protein
MAASSGLTLFGHRIAIYGFVAVRAAKFRCRCPKGQYRCRTRSGTFRRGRTTVGEHNGSEHGTQL